MKKLEESIREMENEESFLQKETELGSVMKNLDSDSIDISTAMSSIDFNARLTSQEINACLIFDELVRLGILPVSAGLTRQKKRLSVSKDGQGREEKVRIVQGEREHSSGSSFGERFKNLFSRRE